MKTEIINYAKGLNSSTPVLEFLNEKIDFENERFISEWEHIVDFLIHKDFSDLKWASFSILKEKAQKWIRLLSQNVSRIDEEFGIDIETILDFEDGFRFVKLISQKSYQREGALMSHCVSSYFGRNVEIFSLRDSFNKPHCTIEKDVQIKGKGNGDISPKYIDYVVKFLEFSGMKVRDSEMEHLGYIVPEFPEYVENKLYKNRYIRKNEEIKYSENVIIFTDLKKACKYEGDKICLFSGDAFFGNSQVENLGSLESIGGNAYFSYSKIKDLKNLESIGGNAYFSYSKIKDWSDVDIKGEVYR